MSDLAPDIGQRPLRQLVIPGSHDAATYGSWPPFVALLAQAQSLDITSQLDAGSRWFDLRFTYLNDALHAPDYYNFHGFAVSNLTMRQVLSDIVAWSEQHPQEILLLDIGFGSQFGSDAKILQNICSQTLGAAAGAGLVLQPSMVPQLFKVPWPYDMSINEIWALPGHPRIITNWADCTGQSWPAGSGRLLPFSTRYADHCYSSQQIIDALAPSLAARTDDNGALASGIYTLFIQGTPEAECVYLPVAVLAPLQGPVLTAIEGWRQQNQNNAPANLNVIAGDFLGDPAGDTQWPIVATALDLDQNPPAPALGQRTSTDGMRVTCENVENLPQQMMAYPTTEGRVGLDSVRWQGIQPGQLDLVRDQFPPGNFNVRVDCTTSQGVVSSLTVPTDDLPGMGCPQPVGGFVKSQSGPEIDVMAPGCQRRDIPNPATFQQIRQTWNPSGIQTLTPADFANLAQGPAIPDYTTDQHGFAVAMQDIYGAKCFSQQVNVGTLFQLSGSSFYEVLDGGCALWGIANQATLQVIESRYNLTVQPLSQNLIGFFYGSPNEVPDYTTDPAGFEQAMQEIYGH